MAKYKVKLKDSKRNQSVEAKSELEAKFKFCEKNNFSFRYLAGKIVAVRADGRK